jgi:outer membrane protein assembly factor BamB
MTSFLALLCLCLAAPAGEDWPWWNGPERTGVSREKGWSVEGKPEPLWRAQVGLGYSSFSIQGGRLFTLGYDPEKKRDTIYAFGALDGKPLWTHSYPSEIWDHSHGGGALSTPTADGDVLYTSEREGEFLCLAAASGEVKWRVQVQKDLGLTPPTWGFAASPLLFDERLILNYGPVVAFDKHTGKELWRSARHYGHAYSTPVDFDYKGTRALAVFDGDGLGVVALADGKELAFAPWEVKDKVKAMTPVVIDLKVFVSAYPWGGTVIDLSGEQPKKLWATKVMSNQESGCVPWQGYMYGFDVETLKCIDVDGNEKWRERGLGAGAVTVADGRLLLVTSEGELIVAEATPERFHELSRRAVLDVAGAPFWTVPVLANGVVYVRSHAGELVALDHRPAK